MNRQQPGIERTPGVTAARLRVFAHRLAAVCAEIGLVGYDITCEFTPRERPEYASIRARNLQHGHLRRIEDVIPISLFDAASEPTEEDE